MSPEASVGEFSKEYRLAEGEASQKGEIFVKLMLFECLTCVPGSVLAP